EAAVDAVVAQHGFHVVARLAEADQLDELVGLAPRVAPLPLGDRVLAAVVGGERLDHGPVVLTEQAREEPRPEVDVGPDFLARPLAMGSGELARERRRPLGRSRLAHRLAPAEALLGEPGVVGAGVALGYVHEELARLRPAPEACEHARLPVFRGDACHPRAPPGEP